MSSNKDILDRISKTGGRTTVRKRVAAEPAGAPEGAPKTQTRVRAGVIRRRKKTESPPVGPPKLKKASPALKAPIKKEAPPVEEPPVVQEPPVEAAPVEAKEEVEKVVTDTAPEVEAVVEAPVEEPPVEVVAEAPQETEVVAESAPVSIEEPTVAASADAGEESVASVAPVKVMPKLPGLGSAVIAPPPGYDPANPDAHVAAPAAKKKTTKPADRWADEDRAKGKDDKKTSRRGDGEDRSRQRRRGRREAFTENFASPSFKRRKRTKRAGPKKASPKPSAQKRRVQVDETISLKQLSHEMSVKANDVIKILMGMGSMVTLNEQLDFETAQLVAAEFDYEVVNVSFQEEEHLVEVAESVEENEGDTRPPVVTIMGHVDHGKTTLLDAIRGANVVDGEAGGITQHIGAYQVDHNGSLVTFIDTPGHEAFTSMRARGANATDIAILVVAADDGIMPQTIESINHVKAADVPLIVAVNKCDKPGVNPELVKQRLMEHGLVPEEFGGDTMTVNVSALKRTGLDGLLDAIQLIAEVSEFKAVPDRHATGVVLEARLEKGRGAVATILVKDGTLKKGDPVVFGSVAGKIRAMNSYAGKTLKEAGPSTPVEVIGLAAVPKAGDDFVVVKNDKAAKALASHREAAERDNSGGGKRKMTLEDLMAMGQGDSVEKKNLNLVVKADVQGSIEALKVSLEKLDIEGVDVKVLHGAVGGVTESDVTLAAAYNAIIVAFNVRPAPKARRELEKQGVDYRFYRVIYEALDEIQLAAKGKLDPVITENVTATIEVRQVFTVPKVGAIAGCMVTDGQVMRRHKARLLRDSVVVWEGDIASLRRFKDDVRKVESGYECGVGLHKFNDIKTGDIIETYEMVENSA